jgi:hypothetical protein
MTMWRKKGDAESGHQTAGELGHSQFGTPLDQILNTRVRPDVRKWLTIPANWGGRSRDPEQWAERMAPLVWDTWVELNDGAVHPGPDAVARTALELRTYAEHYGGFDPTQPFEILTYLYLPDPAKPAFPLHLCVDDRPGLTVEQATADPEALQTPVAEEFRTDGLGVGRKVTCHGTLDPQPGDLPGTQAMWVSVYYAFAVPGRQAVVTVRATDTDLAWMSAAAGDLDEFVRSITLELTDGTPVPVAPAR